MSSKTMRGRRQKQMIRTAYVAAVLACGASIAPVSAQTVVTWDGGPTTGAGSSGATANDWSTLNNWVGDTNYPNTSDEQALFSGLGTHEATDIDANTTVDIYGIHYTGSTAYTIDIVSGTVFTMSGSGIDNDSTAQQTIDIESGGSLIFSGDSTVDKGSGSVVLDVEGATGGVTFNGTSSAGNATITNNAGGTVTFNGASSESFADAGTANITNTGVATGGGNTAQTIFNGFSSASGATITNNARGETIFNDDSNAGTATISNTTATSLIDFNDGADAANATIINNLGTVDIAGVTDGSIAIGSLSGSGNVVLGSNELVVGNLNQNNTISGVISGDGGALTKTGTGELTLSGANTYTGDTNVNDGTLTLGASGSLESHVNVASGTTFNVSGDANKGVTNAGTTNVLAGGTVNGGDVYVAEVDETANVGIYNQGGEVGVAGTVNGDDVGVANFNSGENNGVTRVLDGGVVNGGYVGIHNEGDQNTLVDVQQGGSVYGDNTGILNIGGKVDITGGSVQGGNVPGDAETIHVGVYNQGGTVNIAGVMVSESMVEGTVDGTDVGVANTNDHSDPNNPVIGTTNVLTGGVVTSGDTGAYNDGVLNISGSVSGDVVGVFNGFDETDPENIIYGQTNVNAGGTIFGGDSGIENEGGTVNIAGAVEGINVGVVNTNNPSGIGATGGDSTISAIGDTVIGTTNVLSGGSVTSDDTGVYNDGVLNISGSVSGGIVGVFNGFSDANPNVTTFGETNVNASGTVYGGDTGLENEGVATVDGEVRGGNVGVLNHEGATLSGVGDIVSDGEGEIPLAIINDGILQPGSTDPNSANRYGTLRANGDVYLSPGSTFITNVGAEQNSALSVTNGDVYVDGATLQANVDSPFYHEANPFILTDANGTIDGQFSNEDNVIINGDVSGIQGYAEVVDGDYILYLSGNPYEDDTPTGGNAGRFYQYLARNFDNPNFSDIQEKLADLNDSLGGNSSNTASVASGEGTSGTPTAASFAAHHFINTLLNQLHQQPTGNNDQVAAAKAPRLVYNGTRYAQLLAQANGQLNTERLGQQEPGSRSSVWATIGRDKDNIDSDGGGSINGVDFRSTNYTVGYTRALSSRNVLGISVGKSDGNYDADNGTDGDLDTTSLGLGLRHDSDNWYAIGALSYSRHDIDVEDLAGRNGDTDGRSIQLSGEVGKKMGKGRWRIEPHINFLVGNTKIDDYTLNGPLSLNVGSSDYSTRRLGLGVRIAGNNAAARFRPYFVAAYQREFGDRRAESTNSFAGIGGGFGVEGPEVGRNIVNLRLGTDARVSDRFSLIGEISGTWRENENTRSIFGGIKYQW